MNVLNLTSTLMKLINWEEVVIAVARPPVSNKRIAETIAEKHLVHSPNKDRILDMIKGCDTYYYY